MVNEKIVYYDNRPWGNFEVIKALKIDGEDIVIKTITVLPNMRLSLQSHKHRIENWVIVSGECHIENNQTKTEAKKGDIVHIEINSKHRVTNTSKDKPLVFIEVAQGEFDENDITRYEDDFGRN